MLDFGNPFLSIEKHTFDEAAQAFEFLDMLALSDDYLFRGHTKAEYRLVTSLERHRPGMSWTSGIDDLIDRFRVGLTRLGIVPFESDQRLDWLEYARHHGVPTPVLDFTYSPYVALFFAFNGITVTKQQGDAFTVIYAINIAKLASAWATLTHDPTKDREEVAKRHREFLYPKGNLFDSGFPMRCLQFIPHPGRFNYRMHRQQGALLYDTLQYMYLQTKDLDDLIEAYDESTEPFTKGMRDPDKPTAYTIYIHVRCASDVFRKLEMMGMNGGTLFMNADGVACDVANSIYFHSRVSYLRDLRFPRSEI